MRDTLTDQRLDDILKLHHTPSAPQGFTEAVMTRIANEPQLATPPRRHMWLYATASAAAALVAAVSLMQLQPQQDTGFSQLASNDDAIVEIAYASLEDTNLQDALCAISDTDSIALSEQELVDLIY